MATIPASDLAAIEAYCERHSPPELVEQLRVESAVDGDAVILVESRVPSDPDARDSAWHEAEFARLRFDPATGLWALDWSDDTGTWHRYGPAAPGPVGSLLAAIDEDATDLFRG